ncbi:MAG: DNA translocase FtsK 4TM domain-containing protein, partial [Lachnospiraceae bacterium]
SNFNLGGAVGGAINGVMFGLFGILAYLFPVILFFGMAFFLANRGNRTLPVKMLYALGMLLMLTAFIQLLTTYLPTQWSPAKEGDTMPLGQYYTLARDYKKGGGIFGGFVCYLFEPLFGRVGSFVVVIAVFLVCFMLFSKKALFAWIARRSSERYALHKVHAMERRESFEQRQAERERLVEEKRKELGERRAKTYLLSEEEKFGKEAAVGQESERQPGTVKKEKEKEKRNFFGGRTPTGEYTLDLNHQYTLPEQTISEVNTLYNEEHKQQNTGLHMMEISPETGEYKETTYVEREKTAQASPKRTEPAQIHRGPTVAEQLEALGGQRDRQTSGGQVFWGNSGSSEAKQTEQEKVRDADASGEDIGRTDASDDSTYVEQRRKKNEYGSMVQESGSKVTGAAKEDVAEPLVIEESEPVKRYEFPPVELLTKPKGSKGVSERDLQETARKLQSTLESFGVRVTVTNVSCGPAVTRYELQPEQGVKVSKITSLADDIKLNLAAADVRIEAPIPGKAAVGIEVPNKENST